MDALLSCRPTQAGPRPAVRSREECCRHLRQTGLLWFHNLSAAFCCGRCRELFAGRWSFKGGEGINWQSSQKQIMGEGGGVPWSVVSPAELGTLPQAIVVPTSQALLLLK